MDKQERAQLVQFVTGTSKVPLEGFKALQGISGPQKFQIHKAYGHGKCVHTGGKYPCISHELPGQLCGFWFLAVEHILCIFELDTRRNYITCRDT